MTPEIETKINEYLGLWPRDVGTSKMHSHAGAWEREKTLKGDK
jgi:hypothetical protein